MFHIDVIFVQTCNHLQHSKSYLTSIISLKCGWPFVPKESHIITHPYCILICVVLLRGIDDLHGASIASQTTLHSDSLTWKNNTLFMPVILRVYLTIDPCKTVLYTHQDQGLQVELVSRFLGGASGLTFSVFQLAHRVSSRSCFRH